jgi:hypothetical protein
MYVKARIFVEFVPSVEKKDIGEKRSCNKSTVVEMRFEGNAFCETVYIVAWKLIWSTA